MLTALGFEHDLEPEVALALLGDPGDHAVILAGYGREADKIWGPWGSERRVWDLEAAQVPPSWAWLPDGASSALHLTS